MEQHFAIRVFKESLMICRLDRDAPVPNWATKGFSSYTRTPDELSIVCTERSIPEYIRCEKGWRYFRIDSTLDFSLVGILASISGILAHLGVSIFAISTYDTDYILVREQDLVKAIGALQDKGYEMVWN